MNIGFVHAAFIAKGFPAKAVRSTRRILDDPELGFLRADTIFSDQHAGRYCNTGRLSDSALIPCCRIFCERNPLRVAMRNRFSEIWKCAGAARP